MKLTRSSRSDYPRDGSVENLSSLAIDAWVTAYADFCGITRVITNAISLV